MSERGDPGEFDLIDLIRRRVGALGAGVHLGIGDDAAVLELPPGKQLVVSTDTLNGGVHFAEGTDAQDLGYKALAVNLSDLAAMGARPRWALLNLTLPRSDLDWLTRFMEGFQSLAGEFGVTLVGGDTTRGPLALTVTALGTVEPGRLLTRSGARAGDRVVISGTLGGAALALAEQEAGQELDANLEDSLLRPQPRVQLGQSLAGLATACIDVSDGLLADLGHICEASGLAAVVDLAKLPAPGQIERLGEEQRWKLQLAGGDDYELCFTIPPERAAELDELRLSARIPLSIIGEMRAGRGVHCRRPDGTEYQPGRAGFDHFGAAGLVP